ncbi:hypothetical protein I316_07160 [Kwoniella heveanensis BCC8398]|uniref:Uncharacterized protein n=1 Tax=Kwoniella heveanensis BCC8398 TaxID=1296120 RepID=A0A1B9GJC3_9TREE|nr:hypothetical protein I316_07160 [Kwoniella heveanensis BCC8398]
MSEHTQSTGIEVIPTIAGGDSAVTLDDGQGTVYAYGRAALVDAPHQRCVALETGGSIDFGSHYRFGVGEIYIMEKDTATWKARRSSKPTSTKAPTLKRQMVEAAATMAISAAGGLMLGTKAASVLFPGSA